MTTSICTADEQDDISSPIAEQPFSPLPSFDSTLTALLEEDESAVNDGKLLLPIEYQQYAVAAAGDVEPQTEQQLQDQFGQLAVASAEHAALPMQMNSTAAELMQHLDSSACSTNFFTAAMGGAGGYVGLDEGLDVEERRKKIHSYIKMRNRRNFYKKIKYPCRKTLADSRPRLHGRFAKNDDDDEPSSRSMQIVRARL